MLQPCQALLANYTTLGHTWNSHPTHNHERGYQLHLLSISKVWKIQMHPRRCVWPIFDLLYSGWERGMKSCASEQQHRTSLQFSILYHRQEFIWLDKKLLRASCCPHSSSWDLEYLNESESCLYKPWANSFLAINLTMTDWGYCFSMVARLSDSEVWNDAFKNSGTFTRDYFWKQPKHTTIALASWGVTYTKAEEMTSWRIISSWTYSSAVSQWEEMLLCVCPFAC